MNNQPDQNQEQEVDLVPVFVWISNGFKNLFNGIGNIFKGIAHFLVLFLIFIKNNIILLGVLFVIGAALGMYLSRESKKNFTAQLRVQPNFESAGQLISNIEYYNSLVDQEDYQTLGQQLKVSTEEASYFVGFEIEPDFNDTELLKEYDYMARRADTIALENYTFEGFKKAKRDIDYQFYKVSVTSKNRAALEKAAPDVVEVKDNPLIKAQRTASIETTGYNIAKREYQLKEIDSLISAYQIAIKDKDSDLSNGTNVFVNGQNGMVDFKNLFQEKSNILFLLETEREKKYQFENTVNIVSYLIKKGSIEKKHLTVTFALVFFGLGLIIALIPILWRFLNTYQKKD
ncbi:hypothetical protein LX97_01228 [Nonlabens dokdonensis]|uniref:Uncharacterized protein n=2 Tax=Nonlabens dokdonensis TaxID=328515 RepID=L7W8M0_NONDD|nr:hypothetical protein [Nonlabens dokdonensis]AGC76567.1 hypothetical protein DDD_1440 [Nonlabens dokdonensis DSW-6]PZX44218.1 hypothetical protein LX97_01228 [Nonlabens dokdonensis]